MQRTPFDGCVFHVDYTKAGGGQGSFTWEAWGPRAFTESELKNAFTDLKAVRFGHFKDNSETPRWWSAEGQPVKIPTAYDTALRQARTENRPAQ